jgi:hypothetical protein
VGDKVVELLFAFGGLRGHCLPSEVLSIQSDGPSTIDLILGCNFQPSMLLGQAQEEACRDPRRQTKLWLIVFCDNDCPLTVLKGYVSTTPCRKDCRSNPRGLQKAILQAQNFINLCTESLHQCIYCQQGFQSWC